MRNYIFTMLCVNSTNKLILTTEINYKFEFKSLLILMQLIKVCIHFTRLPTPLQILRFLLQTVKKGTHI